MKFTNEDGFFTIYFGKTNQHLFHFYNDWEQIFGKWNWYTLTIANIEFERDLMVPGYEFTFILIGLGFRIRWNDDWQKSENGRELLNQLEEPKDK